MHVIDPSKLLLDTDIPSVKDSYWNSMLLFIVYHYI